MTGNYAAGGNGYLQLKGAGQLAKGLRQAGIEMRDLRAVNKQAAQIVAPEAKSLAPKGKTGRLAKACAPAPPRKPVSCAPETRAR